MVPDHPYFVGLQAHPEFCTRPLNPSPPFLGFVAAAAGANVLREVADGQAQSFVPPHPKESMVGEQALVATTKESLLTEGKERVLRGGDSP